MILQEISYTWDNTKGPINEERNMQEGREIQFEGHYHMRCNFNKYKNMIELCIMVATTQKEKNLHKECYGILCGSSIQILDF